MLQHERDVTSQACGHAGHYPGWMPMRARGGPVAALLVMLLAAACGESAGGTASAGGRGSGGDGADAGVGGGQSETRWCGFEQGPPCEPGAPCNPAQSGCAEASPGMRCQPLGDDCVDLEVPVCEYIPLNCGTGDSGPLACACSGNVAPLNCVLQNSRRSWDATRCSSGSFPCGDEECAQWLEVCVESDSVGSEPHCALARQLGCGTYDLTDCRCLELEGGQECVHDPDGHFVVRLADVP